MGLCKCRKVTSLFCYRERKNVCEQCIITEHKRCIVKSYIQWLQDSDYENTCQICQISLDEGPVENLIRLCCFDLFHVSCINKLCTKLYETNPNTARFDCPLCNHPIIPANNVTTEIAETVRNTFKTEQWAKLLLPTAHDDISSSPQLNPLKETNSEKPPSLKIPITPISTSVPLLLSQTKPFPGPVTNPSFSPQPKPPAPEISESANIFALHNTINPNSVPVEIVIEKPRKSTFKSKRDDEDKYGTKRNEMRFKTTLTSKIKGWISEMAPRHISTNKLILYLFCLLMFIIMLVQIRRRSSVVDPE